jgi:hypothetical protein
MGKFMPPCHGLDNRFLVHNNYTSKSKQIGDQRKSTAGRYSLLVRDLEGRLSLITNVSVVASRTMCRIPLLLTKFRPIPKTEWNRTRKRVTFNVKELDVGQSTKLRWKRSPHGGTLEKNTRQIT